MTIWVMQQQLSTEEEQAIHEREALFLPLKNLPDLSRMTTMQQFRQMLKELYPDAPPEQLTRMAERDWPFIGEVHSEDLILVPLTSMGRVAIAEVTGRYHFLEDEYASALHSIPVKWHEKQIPLGAFRKHKLLFEMGPDRIIEVTDLDAKTIVRNRLPHSYNRFVKIKWIIALFFAWRAVMYILHMFGKGGGGAMSPL